MADQVDVSGEVAGPASQTDGGEGGSQFGLTAAIDHRDMQTPRFARDMIVAVLSLVFSILFIWYSRNTGQSFGSTGRRSSWPPVRCCWASRSTWASAAT